MKKALITLVFAVFPLGAQDPVLALKDAVRLALDKNKSVEASVAARNAAETRISQARSGRLPKVNYSESWTRSDNPVFVFSSLLTQNQFGAQNFQIGPLNQPNFLNNFQSQLTADQVLYGAGQTKHAIRSAELTKDIASEDGRRTQMEVIAGVIRAYYDALLSADQLTATAQAMRSAEADLARARDHSLRGNVHGRRYALDTRTLGERPRTADPPGSGRRGRACGLERRHWFTVGHTTHAYQPTGSPGFS